MSAQNKTEQGSSEQPTSEESQKKAAGIPQANKVAQNLIDKKSGQKAKGAFKTISEVADELDVQQHVLRFWETKFPHVRPLKRGGGRRYYRPEDVELLHSIRYLLYTEGYTIKGVQKLLRDKGKNFVLSQEPGNDDVQNEPVEPEQASLPQTQAKQQSHLSAEQKQVLRDMLDNLKEIRKMINS